MNKAELIAAFADAHDLTKAEAGRMINTLFDPETGLVVKTVKKGNKLTIPGFGVFGPKKRPARKMRNPQNGQQIKVAASTVMAFKAGTGVKSTLNPRRGK